MPLHLDTPIVASSLADAISAVGLLATVAWILMRFGPLLLRVASFCSWTTAWACGSQGG